MKFILHNNIIVSISISETLYDKKLLSIRNLTSVEENKIGRKKKNKKQKIIVHQ